MKTEIRERKELAVDLMEKLGIYKPYIKEFAENGDHTCFYENFAGFWVYQDKQLFNKMAEIELKYNCTVYAITHEITKFGECYSFLIVPEDDEDWENLVSKQDKHFFAFAYVWNKTYEPDSEFGSIIVQSFGGGIRRVG